MGKTVVWTQISPGCWTPSAQAQGPGAGAFPNPHKVFIQQQTKLWRHVYTFTSAAIGVLSQAQ